MANADAAPQWTVAISCPRPRNRARDNFHTRPDRVARTTADFFGRDAEITLTARTVRLRYTGNRPPGNIAEWHERLATVLSCLWLDTRGEDGRYRLPHPVRTEILETA